MSRSREIVVTAPVVAFKGPHDTDASMFLEAAKRLDGGYPIGGSNLARAVSQLLRSAAAALQVETGDKQTPSRPR